MTDISNKTPVLIKYTYHVIIQYSRSVSPKTQKQRACRFPSLRFTEQNREVNVTNDAYETTCWLFESQVCFVS